VSPRPRAFAQVDVFTGRACYGNGLAVVLDGTGLATEDMQRFTDWTQLSEATFLLPPTQQGAAGGADYRVRIFCPGRELPFAGHPTLGSCHAWLEAGGSPKQAGFVVQECGVGLVRLRREHERLAFAAPPLRRGGPLPEARIDELARALRVPRGEVLAGAYCDNGPGWQALMLRSADQVLALDPDRLALAGQAVGVIGAHAAGSEFAFEVRAFFPGANGTAEDPVTGSLNAALAQWLIGAGLAPTRYVARQGTALGRDGRVFVDRQGQDIWIGGQSVTCIRGNVAL
jgi:PhzF family phenazine biosynthesis protein